MRGDRRAPARCSWPSACAQELEHTCFETELGKLKVTCSLGVATYPEHARDRETLFDASDRALYKAKHSGRNRVEIS